MPSSCLWLERPFYESELPLSGLLPFLSSSSKRQQHTVVLPLCKKRCISTHPKRSYPFTFEWSLSRQQFHVAWYDSGYKRRSPVLALRGYKNRTLGICVRPLLEWYKGLNAILEVAFYASNFLFSFFVPKKEPKETQ